MKASIIFINKSKKLIIKILYIIIIISLYIKQYNSNIRNGRKRIGVIGVLNEQNAGNNMVKFSMSTILKQYGFEPIIISTTRPGSQINFLKKYVKLKEINSFSELKENDYDILMVNSDQTWSRNRKLPIFDYGFLNFSNKWKIPKFIYGASMGTDYWQFSRKFDMKAKNLLKNFTGISVREKGIVKLAKKHLGIKPLFVLDPTFLINKNYYLEIIKNYKRNFNFNDNYLFIYQLDNNQIIKDFIEEACLKLKYKIYKATQYQQYYVENFIFGINISKAVITDSFHGTVFSIIFNKPFISFVNSRRGRGRFYSLNETFKLNKRLIFPIKNNNPDIKLLLSPLNINKTLFNNLKNISINFLKKNINIYVFFLNMLNKIRKKHF